MKRNSAFADSRNQELRVFNLVKKSLQTGIHPKLRGMPFLVRKFVRQIIMDAKDFSSCAIEYTGSEYLKIGDLRLSGNIRGKRVVRVYELKFGKDTLANIGENSLTDVGGLGFFKDVLSWKDYRSRYGFDSKVKRELLRINKNVLEMNNSQVANFVRRVKKEIGVEKNCEIKIDQILNNSSNFPVQIVLKAEVLKNIIQAANQNKEKYIKYLRSKSRFIDIKKLRQFYYQLSLGVTPNKEDLEEYEYYYLTPDGVKHVSKIKRLKLKVLFGKQHILIHGPEFDLKIVFHWKNVMQGIQTPCLNIFKID